MTMYVRTVVPMAITISSQDRDDDVVIDSRSPYKVLPLWAAQRVEFQELWDEEKVEVATDTAFTNIITSIPVSELDDLPSVRGLPNGVASLDSSGKIPASQFSASGLRTALSINNVDNTSDATKNSAVATLTNKTLTAAIVDAPSGQDPLLVRVNGNTAFTFNQYGELLSLAGYGIFYDGNVSSTAFSSTGPLFLTSGKSTGNNHNISLKASGTGKVNLLSSTNVAAGNTIDLYNTADQTTNFEKIALRWNASQAEVGTYQAGTGISRLLRLGLGVSGSASLSRFLQVQGGTTGPAFQFWGASGTFTGDVVQIMAAGQSSTLSSGSLNCLAIGPTINQTGTAGYTGLLINSTETATGSGTKRLIDAQVGGVSRFNVDNAGLVSANSYVSAQTSTATAAGTTTLTIASSQTQVFTGTTTQTVRLPTTGVLAGQTYKIINNSTGAVTVQSSGGNTVATVSAGTLQVFIAQINTPTTAAHWRAI